MLRTPAILVLIALIFVFPLVFMVMSSVKPDAQLLRDAATIRALLPVGDISLDNDSAAFYRAPNALFVFNGVLVTRVTVSFSLSPVCLHRQYRGDRIEGLEH